MSSTARLLRRHRRLLDRISRAERRLRKRKDSELPAPPGECVEVSNQALRRQLRKELSALAGCDAFLCGNARCVSVQHLGEDPRPKWVQELSASLARWRRQLSGLSSRVAKAAMRRVLKLRKLVAYAEAQLGDTAGELGGKLGEKPSTPCIKVTDPRIRRVLREAVAVAMLGPRPAYAYVCHACDTPQCVNGAHLFWGSARDNARDRAIKRRCRGQDGVHLRLKLTDWRAELAEAEALLASAN